METDRITTCVMAAVHAEASLCCRIGGRKLPALLSWMAASVPSNAASTGVGPRQTCQAEPGAGAALQSRVMGVSYTRPVRAEVTAALRAGRGLRHQPGRLLPVQLHQDAEERAGACQPWRCAAWQLCGGL